MMPKPTGLGPVYAAQFEDESVAQAYRARPPYPSAVFPWLGSLQPNGPGRALELGCGTGDLTIGLASHVTHIDAVQPSAAMLHVARARCHGDPGRIKWHATSAESFRFTGRYSLAVAAASLHWMDWAVVLPKIGGSLNDGAFLAVVNRSRVLPRALQEGLNLVIPRFSTNRDFQPYDVVDELDRRGLFHEVGRRQFAAERFTQSVDDFVESIHSQNGFSRDQMSEEAAAAFDDEVRQLAMVHVRDGLLTMQVGATVVWGLAGDA